MRVSAMGVEIQLGYPASKASRPRDQSHIVRSENFI